MLRVVVLGAAAGGGIPQWNCGCPICRAAREGRTELKSTQCSVAISADGDHWFLINASPDLRQQIEARPCLHPRVGLRSSPIEGVILTGADVDAVGGLLHMRERQAFALYATQRMLDVLEANPIFEVLSPECVRRYAVPLGESFQPRHVDESGSGLEVELFDVPGKVALWLEAGRPLDELAGAPGDTVGVEVRSNGKRLLYIPGCAAINEALRHRLREASVVLFDGTLWQDDEMIRQGLGPKSGRRMGHMRVSGPDGTLAAFRDIPVGRKILIHINNSNPILLDDSRERAGVEKEGWEVAYDGMEVQP